MEYENHWLGNAIFWFAVFLFGLFVLYLIIYNAMAEAIKSNMELRNLIEKAIEKAVERALNLHDFNSTKKDD